jgi:hypothetical protein
MPNIPTWGWVLLVVAAVIIAPIKMRVFKSMLTKKEVPEEEEE